MSLHETLNRHDRSGLILNIGLAVGAALIIDIVIFAAGWNSPGGRTAQPWFAPPGWVAALVWLVLFALMATARWKLNSYTIIGVVPARRLVTLLIVSCLLWPFYSIVTGSATGSFIGTVVTLVLAAFAIAFVQARSRDAALLLVPVILWLSFVLVIPVAELGWV